MRRPRVRCTILHFRNRAHRWRRRDAERRFVIGYVGIAEGGSEKYPDSPHRQRYEAAVFRFDEDADSTLLWVADEAVGFPDKTIDGVHGAIRRNLWKANAEAIEWVRLVEEFGEAPEFDAYATFTEFERAVDGLAGATLGSVPRDLMNERDVLEEHNFDLWDSASARPIDR